MLGVGTDRVGRVLLAINHHPGDLESIIIIISSKYGYYKTGIKTSPKSGKTMFGWRSSPDRLHATVSPSLRNNPPTAPKRRFVASHSLWNTHGCQGKFTRPRARLLPRFPLAPQHRPDAGANEQPGRTRWTIVNRQPNRPKHRWDNGRRGTLG